MGTTCPTYFTSAIRSLLRLDSGADRDSRTMERVAGLESSINDILLGQRRPGAEYGVDDRNLERRSAVQRKTRGRFVEYRPGGDEIDEAITSMARDLASRRPAKVG